MMHVTRRVTVCRARIHAIVPPLCDTKLSPMVLPKTVDDETIMGGF